MASGDDKNAPAGEDQADNILNEQPIEISSESSNDASGSEQANSESESEVSDVVVNSVSESSSEFDADQKLEDDFAMQLARPGKRYRQFMELCTTAFQLNVFDKIETAVKTFDMHSVIPPHIWLRYLKCLKRVTQTPDERTFLNKRCAKALSSHYDEPLAEFVVTTMFEEPLVEQHLMWAKVLADYCIERVDFIRDLRKAILLLTDQEEIELVEKTMSAQVVTWNCNEEQLDSIEMLIEDFKKNLDDSVENTAWLQEMYILKAETLTLSKKMKYTLAKFFYERCLAKYPTDATLWLDYVAYMSKPVESGGNAEIHTEITDGYLRSKPIPLITRALRTKPTIAINHKFLELMEHYDLSVERIEEALNEHFERIEPLKEMCVELHLDYLAYRVRNTNIADKDQVKKLRSTFRNIWDRLSDQYGDTADTSFEVLQLFAQVEYGKLKNPANGAAIWSEILNYPGSNVKSHLWMAYAQMESEFNGGRRTSVVLQQALNSLSMTSDLQAVLELYRRTERCFGTFDTIAECQAYCQAYSKDSKYSYRLPWPPQQRAQTPYQRPARRQWQPVRRPTLPVAKKEMPKERPKDRPKERPKERVQKKPPPSATVTSNESKESNFKYSSGLETNKIFIKNLYSFCTKEDLTKLFSEYGAILDIRMIQKPNHKNKFIAYIEFETAGAAQKAVIGADGKTLGGLKIEVAISNPPPKVITGSSTSAAAAAAAGASKSLGAGSMAKAEKRRPKTSLIPTRLLMQKRRKKLELDDDSAVSSSSGENTNSTKSEGDTANGKESVADKEKKEAAADKKAAEKKAADKKAADKKAADKKKDDKKKDDKKEDDKMEVDKMEDDKKEGDQKEGDKNEKEGDKNEKEADKKEKEADKKEEQADKKDEKADKEDATTETEQPADAAAPAAAPKSNEDFRKLFNI